MLEPGGDIYAEMNRRVVPYGVNLEITSSCNLDCIHCYHIRSLDPEMNICEIGVLLDELASLGSMELTLTGGEPLLRPDFLDILRHAVEHDGFSVKVFSNLTLIDRNIAAYIAEIGVHSVETTLLGPEASLHDRLTGRAGAFDRTVAGIRLLRDRSVTVSAKTIMMKENMSSLDEMYTLAEKLGVAFRHDEGLFVESNGRRRPLAHRISEYDLMALRRRYGGEPASQVCGPCNAAKSVVSIGPDGDVYPCGAFPIPAGNIRISGFTPVWRDSPLMIRIRSLDEYYYRVCGSCGYDLRCGGCLAMGAGLAEGRVHPCRLARKTIRRFR